MIRNIRRRHISAPANEVGALIDSLASDHDGLWPRDRRPPIRLDRGLRVGSSGGHGPVLYSLSTQQPGCSLRFELRLRCQISCHQAVSDGKDQHRRLRYASPSQMSLCSGSGRRPPGFPERGRKRLLETRRSRREGAHIEVTEFMTTIGLRAGERA